jgi:hypothetical protein
MTRGAFYRIVGRADLDESYTSRLLTKGLSYVLGSVAVTTGVAFFIFQAGSAGCAYWSGFVCVETREWPAITGAITAGVGLAAVLFAALLRSTPTTDEEDHQLADGYNAKLKPPVLPVTASR